MKTIVTKAFAKINLTLDVYERRPDGRHRLESIMQTVSLHDTLELTLSEPKGEPYVASELTDATVKDDICLKTAKLFFKRFVPDPPSLDIKVTKRIPSAAGLGGGSSDAAAVLKALRDEFDISDVGSLMSVASEIGSDVPFFLIGGMGLAEGAGDIVYRLPYKCEQHVLLVKPLQGTSSREVYERFDIEPPASRNMTTALLRELQRGRLPVARCGNALSAAAVSVASESGDIIRLMELAGAEKAMISGSGSTVIGFFPHEKLKKAADIFTAFPFCGIYKFVY